MFFGPIWAKGKLAYLYFYENNRPLEIILAKKTTEIILLFHKNISKLVFLWPNISQNFFKVLITLQ